MSTFNSFLSLIYFCEEQNIRPSHSLYCNKPVQTSQKQKIYALKKREESKSMIVLMNGEKMMYTVFAAIPEVAWQILDLSEKPTTLILDKPRNVAPNIIAEDQSLAVRLVKEPFCFKLMERMKRPLVSTSANISGQPTPKSFKEISP